MMSKKMRTSFEISESDSSDVLEVNMRSSKLERKTAKSLEGLNVEVKQRKSRKDMVRNSTLSSESEGEYRKARKKSELDMLMEYKNQLINCVFENKIDGNVASEIIAINSKFEKLCIQLMNNLVKGELNAYKNKVNINDMNIDKVIDNEANIEVNKSKPGKSVNVQKKKPVETWALVVKSKDPRDTSNDIMKKFEDNVGPKIDVRVHEVKKIKDGGILIRTPSCSETKKLVGSNIFTDAGLTASINDKKRRIRIMKVAGSLTPDEFMTELYSKNLSEIVNKDEFIKKVSLVNKQWVNTADDTASRTVVLECCDEVADFLLRSGKCYIRWFSYHVRKHTEVLTCFRCGSFDHKIVECRYKEDVCHRCGDMGHIAANCSNNINCRNCEFKKLKADHTMFSMNCPIYAKLVARANARH